MRAMHTTELSEKLTVFIEREFNKNITGACNYQCKKPDLASLATGEAVLELLEGKCFSLRQIS